MKGPFDLAHPLSNGGSDVSPRCKPNGIEEWGGTWQIERWRWGEPNGAHPMDNRVNLRAQLSRVQCRGTDDFASKAENQSLKWALKETLGQIGHFELFFDLMSQFRYLGLPRSTNKPARSHHHSWEERPSPLDWTSPTRANISWKPWNFGTDPRKSDKILEFYGLPCLGIPFCWNSQKAAFLDTTLALLCQHLCLQWFLQCNAMLHCAREVSHFAREQI